MFGKEIFRFFVKQNEMPKDQRTINYSVLNPTAGTFWFEAIWSDTTVASSLTWDTWSGSCPWLPAPPLTWGIWSGSYPWGCRILLLAEVSSLVLAPDGHVLSYLRNLVWFLPLMVVSFSYLRYLVWFLPLTIVFFSYLRYLVWFLPLTPSTSPTRIRISPVRIVRDFSCNVSISSLFDTNA